MPVLTVTVLALLGAGLFIALSAALYASLPRPLMDAAEKHGRFLGLESPDAPARARASGTPEAMPESALSGQSA
jgi:hypothetical protein